MNDRFTSFAKIHDASNWRTSVTLSLLIWGIATDNMQILDITFFTGARLSTYRDEIGLTSLQCGNGGPVMIVGHVHSDSKQNWNQEQT